MQQISRGPWVVALLCSVMLITSCAGVRNFDENDTRTGFRHYPGKYYLLVQKTKTGQQIQTITLPDPSRPHTIWRKSGWGSVQFSFALTNGVLSQFGSTTDSKGPETLTAVAAPLIAGYAGILSAQVTAGAEGAIEGAPVPITLDTLKQIANDLQGGGVDPLNAYNTHQTYDATAVAIEGAISPEVANLTDLATLDASKEIIA